MRKTLPAALMILALATTGLSACSNEVPQLPSTGTSPSESEQPNLDEVQVSTLISEVEEALVAGDEALDESMLQPRVKDPALAMRAAMYRLTKARQDTVAGLDMDETAATVTQSHTWPRAIIAPTKATEDELPQIGFITQDNPRDDYKLTSWVRMFPGESLQTIAVSEGSPVVAADADGFVLSPQEALTEWTARLDDKANQPDLFADDEFAKAYKEQLKLNDSLGENGKVTIAATPAEKPLTAVALVDGSALVAGNISFTVTYERVKENAKIKLGGAIADLMEDPQVHDKPVEVTYLASVALILPPKGSSELIHAIGAERVLGSYRVVE
ncbi:hypothetical protein [Gleimia europaea]|uniref:Lipoprotein n=1 Tax=Gleimia europaea ACS-120-V-Col10b TaxID=883069 RepID=A0A9W5VWB7_9ACTO|nr:hypothetical protein [Gleimia europaea]EPD30739.1 hypothetical protein HMPREF9238_00493 [Gleimia europaea ACS-120-V-Col10b]